MFHEFNESSLLVLFWLKNDDALKVLRIFTPENAHSFTWFELFSRPHRGDACLLNCDHTLEQMSQFQLKRRHNSIMSFQLAQLWTDIHLLMEQYFITNKTILLIFNERELHFSLWKGNDLHLCHSVDELFVNGRMKLINNRSPFEHFRFNYRVCWFNIALNCLFSRFCIFSFDIACFRDTFKCCSHTFTPCRWNQSAANKNHWKNYTFDVIIALRLANLLALAYGFANNKHHYQFVCLVNIRMS